MGFMDRISGAYKALVGSDYTKSLEDSMELNQVMDMEMDIEKGAALQEMKAIVEDPLGLLQAMGYKDRQFSLSYDVLRRMAAKDAVIGSILTTRVNQVSTFTTPARFSRSGVGYEIRLRDTNIAPTSKDKDAILAMEQFLENSGYDNDNRRDDFDTFIRKITRDRLTYDQVTFEIVPDRKGRPAEFHAVDASTIRIAAEDIREEALAGQPKLKKNEEISYVQVYNGQIQAYFTAEELAFGVSNPRTDIQIAGYGYSELEMLINQVTSHLWAEEYNSRFFSQGGTTKGILNLKGNATAPISPHQLESFKRQWLSQVSGMTGAWKTPVVSVDGLEYINVSQSNREMEFEKWMNYLINIACAVYQIDPAEINFPNNGGATSSASGGLGDGGMEEKLNHSRDKGLRPLLRFLETMINKHLISKFDQRFVFSFVGIDTKSEKEIATLQQMQVKVFKTVNEIRKEEGLPNLEDADIILDPTYIQYLAQKQQAELMKQHGGEGEDPESTNPEDISDDQKSTPEEEDEGKDNEDSENVGKSMLMEDFKFLTIELDE